jgi:hypothetical protein
MEFKFDEEVDPEEFIAAIIETMRDKGWGVPEWIAEKCRERVTELRERNFTGDLRLVLEVWEGQVADLSIIEAPLGG